MRFVLALLLLSFACEAAPRVYDRGCSIASRRSSRGGVACATPDAGYEPGAISGAPFALASQCTGAALSSSIGAATVTRSSSAYCPKSDGTFALVTANQPRLGKFGVLVEGPATALETSPRDWTNVAWAKNNMTAALTATGADGVANSATRLTATAGNATILQTYNDSGGNRKSFSLSIKRPSGCGSGTVEVTQDNVNAFTCDFTTALATAMAGGCEWLRVSQRNDTTHDTTQICEAGCGALSSLVEDPQFGVKLATSGNCLDVDFGQLEATTGRFSTTPVFGGSRTAETFAIVSTNWPTSAGSIEMKMSPRWISSETGGDYRMIFDTRGAGPASGAYIYSLDGAVTYGVRSNSTATQAAGALDITQALTPFGKPRVWQMEWDAAAVRFNVQGVRRGTNTTTVNLPTANGTAKPGGVYSTNLWGYGWFSDILVGTSNAAASTATATIGDSILNGAYDIRVGDAMAARLSATRKFVTPFAVSGRTVATCTTDYTTHVQGKSFDVVVTNCGINDMLQGASAATAWAANEVLLDLMVSDGFRPVSINLTPCGGYGTCDTDKVTAFNVLWAAYCAAHTSTVTCLDANTAMRNPASPTTLLPAYSTGGDFLHPNNAGSIVYGNLAADAIP